MDLSPGTHSRRPHSLPAMAAGKILEMTDPSTTRNPDDSAVGSLTSVSVDSTTGPAQTRSLLVRSASGLHDVKTHRLVDSSKKTTSMHPGGKRAGVVRSWVAGLSTLGSSLR